MKSFLMSNEEQKKSTPKKTSKKIKFSEVMDISLENYIKSDSNGEKEIINDEKAHDKTNKSKKLNENPNEFLTDFTSMGGIIIITTNKSNPV